MIFLNIEMYIFHHLVSQLSNVFSVCNNLLAPLAMAIAQIFFLLLFRTEIIRYSKDWNTFILPQKPTLMFTVFNHSSYYRLAALATAFSRIFFLLNFIGYTTFTNDNGISNKKKAQKLRDEWAEAK